MSSILGWRVDEKSFDVRVFIVDYSVMYNCREEKNAGHGKISKPATLAFAMRESRTIEGVKVKYHVKLFVLFHRVTSYETPLEVQTPQTVKVSRRQ